MHIIHEFLQKVTTVSRVLPFPIFKCLNVLSILFLVKNRSIRRKCRKSSPFVPSQRFVHRVIHSFCGKLESLGIATTCRVFQKTATETACKFHKVVTKQKLTLSSAIAGLCTEFQKFVRTLYICYLDHILVHRFSRKSLIFYRSFRPGQELPKMQGGVEACRLMAISARFYTDLSTEFVDNVVVRP